MGYTSQSGSFKSSEIEYKINLSKQIDRIADMFSQKIDERHTNMAKAQSILISSQLVAVNFLERMLQPYQDDKYKEALKGIRNEHKKGKGVNDKQVFTEEKFGLLLELMSRKRMLMEEGVEDLEETELPPDDEKAGEPDVS